MAEDSKAEGLGVEPAAASAVEVVAAAFAAHKTTVIERLRTAAEQRSVAAELYRMLGQLNTPLGWEDRLNADIRYRLASEALRRADGVYEAALAAVPTEDLVALVNGSDALAGSTGEPNAGDASA